MGKSPGKWIKSVLFGKKSSKSNLSKEVTGEKRSAAKASLEDLALKPPIQNFNSGSENTTLEKGTSTGIMCDSADLSSVAQDAESQVTKEAISADDAELKRLEQAATKAQAAFRGYLARRAFLALKGIIRLQALIRGHLVRRQAVATLRSMQAIVRLQALARGQKARLSDPAHQVLKKYISGGLKDAKQVDLSVVNKSVRPEKLTASAFVCKLLSMVPIAMPLSLQYDECEPNSVRQWLERWSLSRFWEPLPQPKKVVEAKSQKKQASIQTIGTEPARPKRSVRKVLSAATGDANIVSSSEPEKPRRNVRKVVNHQIESAQDQPQNELERVKQNLRKVTVAVATALEKSEVETDKGQHISVPVQTRAKTSIFSASNVDELVLVNSPEEVSDSISEIDKLAMTEAPMALVVEEPKNVLHNHPTVEQQQLEEENVGKSENSPFVNEELSPKEDQTSKDRIRRRRSLPSKQDNSENISQNTQRVPSYMASTESAKAKLKAQGSPKFSEDGAENGVVRRHSLQPSTNGKFSSLSPRMQRPVQSNGKSGNKNNRSMSASRDEKVLQTDWKR